MLRLLLKLGYWVYSSLKEYQSPYGAAGTVKLSLSPDPFCSKENGDTSCWTKAQTYIALGNTLHILARLKIDSTPMEGIDTELVNKEFEKELGVYQCDLALAIGYHDVEGDYNGKLPKSRRDVNEVFVHI